MTRHKTLKNYRGKIVLITGGAHGIGLSLAKEYEKHHAKVVILDVNKEALEQAKSQLSEVHAYYCDITDKDAVYALAPKIMEEVGVPSILVNNAGVVENSTFLDCPDEKLLRTMNVNVISHFWMLKAFLPSMIKKGKGHVCQVASAAGLMGVSGLVAYCTSKHAAVGLGRALASELKVVAKGKINVTTVCPSFINTGLFKGVKPALLTPMLDQDDIARIIFSAIDEDREIVMEPFTVKLIPALVAFLPPKLFGTVTKFLRVNNAMDEILTSKH